MKIPPEPYSESADWILAESKRRGVEFARDRLSDWSREGLIPEAYVHYPGGGGSTAFYPAGTLLQAVACARLLRNQKSFENVGWKLWIAGFPVREDVWRRQLEKRHRIILKFSTKYLDDGEITEDLSSNIRRVGRAKRLVFPLGGLRRRLGSPGLAMALELLVSVFAGAYCRIEDEKNIEKSKYERNKDGQKDENLIGRLIGLVSANKKRSYQSAPLLADTPSDFLSRLETISPAVSRLQNPRFLADQSAELICAARDEVKFLVAAHRVVRQQEAKLVTVWHPAAAFTVKFLENSSLTFQTSILLGWLACRNIPEWQTGLEQLLRAMQATQAESAGGIHKSNDHL